jgi:hypothetical protein
MPAKPAISQSATQPAVNLLPGRRIWIAFAVAALTGFYLVTSVAIAARRLLWFDEIVTVLISRLPGASRIVAALAQVDNNMPAPYFLVVHWFFQLLGSGAVAARLPSALALAAGLLITFDCARRLTDGLHGLIAFAVLGCSCLPYYGFEARSYGIYFMLAALCFWIWVHGKAGTLSAVLFGTTLFLAIAFHYYAVLTLVPYAAWEALNWKKGRKLPAKLIAGAVGVCGAAAALLPQMSGAKRYSAVFWSPPSLFKLRTAYPDLFPDGVFLLALVVIWVALTHRERNGDPESMQPAEHVGWLGLLIPFAGYLIARLVTNAYVSRYFIGLLPGVAVAFSCWVWRNFHFRTVVPLGILGILAGYGISEQLATVRRPESADPFHQQSSTRRALELEGTLRREGKHFTVLTNGMLYLELRNYARRPEEYVLLVPSEEYLKFHNTPRYTVALSRYYPMQFWNLEDLRTHAAETALLGFSTEDLTLLENIGLRTHTRLPDSLGVTYIE